MVNNCEGWNDNSEEMSHTREGLDYKSGGRSNNHEDWLTFPWESSTRARERDTLPKESLPTPRESLPSPKDGTYLRIQQITINDSQNIYKLQILGFANCSFQSLPTARCPLPTVLPNLISLNLVLQYSKLLSANCQLNDDK